MKYFQSPQSKHGFRSSHLGLLLFVAATLIGASVFFVNPRSAQAVWSPAPTYFGGFVDAIVPFSFIPFCPAHIVVTNKNFTPPVVGLYFIPDAYFQYNYTQVLNGSNFFFVNPALLPGTAILGKYEPVPFPGCALPYPVVPVSSVGPYLMGTGLVPSF